MKKKLIILGMSVFTATLVALLIPGVSGLLSLKSGANANCNIYDGDKFLAGCRGSMGVCSFEIKEDAEDDGLKIECVGNYILHL